MPDALVHSSVMFELLPPTSVMVILNWTIPFVDCELLRGCLLENAGGSMSIVKLTLALELESNPSNILTLRI